LIPRFPVDGETVSEGELCALRWEAAEQVDKHYDERCSLVPPNSSGVIYQIDVAFDADFQFKIGAPLSRTVSTPEFELSATEQSFFVSGYQYYWRLRMLDPGGGPVSDWSDTFSFSIA
jgi:hypothetical protein